jgi:S-adenosylmethionine:tRNA ribosyltransferase-isomerase
MRRSDFYFDLPPELIAQRPMEERSASRLLLLDGAGGLRRDLRFRDLPSLLTPTDLLVFNDTRVVPARVHGVKESGGRIEILLERALDSTTALVHARASKGLKPGARVVLPGDAVATMLGREGDLFRLQFSCDVLPYFEAHGSMPLPPYVGRAPESADRERYQTVYAREPGAVAAPTAGLHFDARTFTELEALGVRHAFVTLHVGAGTFQPVRVDDLSEHVMHEEYLVVPESTAAAVNATRAAGGRVIAVGTTVVRSLETAAAAGAADARGAAGVAGVTSMAGDSRLGPYRGATRLFITPGYEFRVVDAMVTNFHLPESTLLMLCAAFVGREALFDAYAHAIAAGYRFFSYGDAMFLTPAAVRGLR